MNLCNEKIAIISEYRQSEVEPHQISSVWRESLLPRWRWWCFHRWEKNVPRDFRPTTKLVECAPFFVFSFESILTVDVRQLLVLPLGYCLTLKRCLITRRTVRIYIYIYIFEPLYSLPEQWTHAVSCQLRNWRPQRAGTLGLCRWRDEREKVSQLFTSVEAYLLH